MSGELHYLFTPMTKPDAPPHQMPNRIRELRKAAGLTIEALAERADMSQPMLGFLETGKRDLKHVHQRRIAAALGVAPADLLNDDEHSIILTQDERKLLDDYRTLDAGNRRAVRGVAESLSAFVPGPASDDDHQPEIRRRA